MHELRFKDVNVIVNAQSKIGKLTIKNNFEGRGGKTNFAKI
jgi:hypothetical protein